MRMRYLHFRTFSFSQPKFAAIFVCACLCCCICRNAQAQIDFNYLEGTYMIKGKITDLQSKVGVPKVNITYFNRKAGVTSNVDGSFTMYVFPSDTLRFTSMGYITKDVAVQDFSKDSIYNINVELMRDFIKLKDVIIYPFGNVDEFKQAFMDAKEVNKFVLPGIAPPKYTTSVPRPKFTNPISFLYEKSKKKRAANPDFRP